MNLCVIAELVGNNLRNTGRYRHAYRLFRFYIFNFLLRFYDRVGDYAIHQEKGARPIKVIYVLSLVLPVVLLIIKYLIGTNYHSIYRYADFSFPSHWTHRRRSKNSILLRPLLHSRWTHFLRSFCLFQENDSRNG